jgi:hypothetical protein
MAVFSDSLFRLSGVMSQYKINLVITGLPDYANPFSDLKFSPFNLVYISDTLSALRVAAIVSSFSLLLCLGLALGWMRLCRETKYLLSCFLTPRNIATLLER